MVPRSRRIFSSVSCGAQRVRPVAIIALRGGPSAGCPVPFAPRTERDTSLELLPRRGSCMASYVPVVLLVLLIAVLAFTGVLQLTNLADMEHVRDRLGCPRGLLRAVAPIQLSAALFLILPETRIWGISAASGLLLAICVIVFKRGRPLWTLLPLTLLAVVGVVGLTIP